MSAAPRLGTSPSSAEAGLVASARPLFRQLIQPIVLACLVAVFAAGVLVGRRGVMASGPQSLEPGAVQPGGDSRLSRSVGATGRSVEGVPAAAGSYDPASAGADLARLAVDRELFDRERRFTVLAITYDTNSQRNRQLAAATVQAFRDRGLPAARPQPSGSALVVVVGAAATQAELADLRDQIQSQPGPSGRPGEFSTAGIYAIDNLIER